MSDRFGINMKRYCREHEARVKSLPPSPSLLAEHLQMIERLQHERLVHLIVLAMTVFVELFAVDLVVLHPQTGLAAAGMMAALAVLLLFYFFHYFFLENTVQRWYKIADEMRRRLGK